MKYQMAIAEYLIAVYERRGLYDPHNQENRQRVFLDVKKTFSEYEDTYDEAYQQINEAVELFRQSGVLCGEKDGRGSYNKLLFNPNKIALCYETVGRQPLGNSRLKMEKLLQEWKVEEEPILEQFRQTQLDRLKQHKPLEFGIGDDEEKLKSVLAALSGIMRLESETYIRNFSEAIFADSKQFQKLRGSIEGILCRYGGKELTKDTVLESFNLLDNPVYIMLKGNIELVFDKQHIFVGVIPGGIALPSTAIPAITEVIIHGDSLISVENLTTYHDQSSSDAAILYLGGFHNSIRTELLTKIYACNPVTSYYHKGDIDVYGFLILENLKDKTGIPFKALDMDLKTLRGYEAHHLVKPLEAVDKKLIKSELPQLRPYTDILTYMLQHNCKAEQEAGQAMALLK